MRRVFVLLLTVVMLASLSVAQGKKGGAKPAGGGGIENHIKQLEQEWANAMVKGDVAAIPKYEAADIVSTDPAGKVTNRDQDVQALKSGEFKPTSMENSDVKVQVYGNVAVATGTAHFKGTVKGNDVSGDYRFTDTWVNRGGKWQCVASQATKIVQ